MLCFFYLWQPRKPTSFPKHLSARFFSDTLVTLVILCCQFGARMGYFAKRLHGKKMHFKVLIKTWEKMKSYNSQCRTFAGLIWLWCSSSGRVGAFRDVNNVDSLLCVKYFQEEKPCSAAEKPTAPTSCLRRRNSMETSGQKSSSFLNIQKNIWKK